MKKTGDQNSIANNTWTAITWDAEDFDTDGFHDNSTNNSRVTIPSGKGGYYLLSIITEWGGTSNETGIRLYKNGVGGLITYNTTTGDQNVSMTIIVNATAGDYYEFYGKHLSGSDRSIYGGGNYTRFSVEYLGA